MFASCLTDKEFIGFGGGITEELIALGGAEFGGVNAGDLIWGAANFLFLLSLGFLGNPLANKPPIPAEGPGPDELTGATFGVLAEKFPWIYNLPKKT